MILGVLKDSIVKMYQLIYFILLIMLIFEGGLCLTWDKSLNKLILY